jgi:hypothetical protein
MIRGLGQRKSLNGERQSLNNESSDEDRNDVTYGAGPRIPPVLVIQR